MLKAEVLAALNKQIQHELTAEYTYLGLSTWCKRETLDGFAAFFRKQAGEEHTHAMKIVDYILDRGGEVTLEAIPAAKTEFKSTLEVLKAAQAFERGTTAAINKVYEVAVKAGDVATQNLMKWYIDEQVEEEAWSDEYVLIGEKIKDSVGSWYMFDHRIGKKAD